MKKMTPPIAFVVAGESISLSAEEVSRIAEGLSPEPIRAHFVLIGGRPYPPKQVLEVATGVDRSDFTTNQARSILRRLGFSLGRTGTTPSVSREAASVSVSREAATPYEARGADALRPHRGRWVAVDADDRVLAAADRPEDVYDWLRRHGKRGALFKVPVDPTVDPPRDFA